MPPLKRAVTNARGVRKVPRDYIHCSLTRETCYAPFSSPVCIDVEFTHPMFSEERSGPSAYTAMRPIVLLAERCKISGFYS